MVRIFLREVLTDVMLISMHFSLSECLVCGKDFFDVSVSLSS